MGLLDNVYLSGSIKAVDFWTKQEKFIEEDLMKCNKSAWILPDYRAQQLTRMFHHLEKHSDVVDSKHFTTTLSFRFEGSVYSSLLQRTSMLPGSGLLNWWSDLINRTDLERNREIEPPVKPKMSRNIQTIFYILLAGFLIALTRMIFELHGIILRVLKTVFRLCVFALLWLVQMAANIVCCKLLKRR